jgi:hypothetical protein
MGMRKRQMIRAALVSVGTYAVSNTAAIVINLVTGSRGSRWLWAAVVALTVLTGLLPLLAGGSQQQPVDPLPTWHSAAAPPRRTSAVPLVVAALLVVLVCGGGGTIGVAAINTAMNKITEVGRNFHPGGIVPADPAPPSRSEPPAVNRLAAGTTTSAGPLKLTVTRVAATSTWIQVGLIAQNTSSEDTLTLPLSQCQLSISGAATRPTDMQRSSWVQDVPPGQKVEGTVAFAGAAPTGAATISLSFATVYGSFDIRSITVSNIRLTG